MIAHAPERQPAMPGGLQTVRQRVNEDQASWRFVLVSLTAQRALWRFVARDVVCFYPTRRSDRGPGLGARGNLTRGLDVAAPENCLCGRPVTMPAGGLFPIGP